MTSRRLAVSGLIALGALAGATVWRAGARAAQANADHPPMGQLVPVAHGVVHAVVRGTGPDLVLIHGASGSLRDFTFDLMDRLTPDFRVIAFDRPGLGHSTPLPEGDVSLAGQVAALKSAADTLGVTNPLLVGQSYGGTVAKAWALAHPAAAPNAPKALVTISAPSLPWPGDLGLWYRATDTAAGKALLLPLASAWVPQSYLHAQIAAVFAPDAPPKDYLDHLGPDLLLRRSQLAANVAQVNGLRDQVVAMEPLYPRITLPFELVHGTADTIVPLHIHSGPFAPRLPNANLTVIDGAGHMPHHTHPDVVLAAIHRAATRAGLR